MTSCSLLALEEEGTADFIKKVLSVYTHSMTTIYLSLSAQVARITFFMKSPVAVKAVIYSMKLGANHAKKLYILGGHFR